MSVARRGESGAASASSYWRLRQRRIQSSSWTAEATRRRWAVAARASRSCWAAEATRRRWAGTARAGRNSAVSSGPIVPRAAKPPIAATTRTTAIPIANISYNNIGLPPPLAVGTKPLAYSLKFHFQRDDLVSGSRHARKSLGEGEAGLAARGPFHWPSRLHRPACGREERPAQLRALHTWHLCDVA